MTSTPATIALRLGTAVCPMDHVQLVRIAGRDAFAVLDRVLPRELYLRDGQMTSTVLLRDDGVVWADVTVTCDDDDYVLFIEGPPREQVLDLLRTEVRPDENASVIDLGASHRLLSVNGPWAWELMSRLEGPEIIGLPYANMVELDGFVCFRAGKTGEYGYDLLCPLDGVDALAGRVAEAGAGLGLESVSLEDLDQCALENHFFNARREGRSELTPLELQLQWRLSYDKDFRGAAALAAARRADAGRRTTTLAARGRVARGDRVRLQDDDIGEVLAAGYSTIRGDWVVLGLLQRGLAHPGLLEVRIGSAIGRSLTTPVLLNRSLFVDRHNDRYAEQNERPYPGLVPMA